MSGQTLSHVAEGVTPLKEDDPLAGLNPEAVPDVVAALRAVNALHPRNIPSNLDEYLQFWDAIDLSRAALAKLEQV